VVGIGCDPYCVKVTTGAAAVLVGPNWATMDVAAEPVNPKAGTDVAAGDAIPSVCPGAGGPVCPMRSGPGHTTDTVPCTVLPLTRPTKTWFGPTGRSAGWAAAAPPSPATPTASATTRPVPRRVDAVFVMSPTFRASHR
jgi:hypothetical protein